MNLNRIIDTIKERIIMEHLATMNGFASKMRPVTSIMKGLMNAVLETYFYDL